MIEQVLNRRNRMRAYRQVVSNKGSAGIDGMAVTDLYAHLTKNREQLRITLERLRKRGYEALLLRKSCPTS